MLAVFNLQNNFCFNKRYLKTNCCKNTSPTMPNAGPRLSARIIEVLFPTKFLLETFLECSKIIW